jgi:hypothetical protein
MEVEYVEASKAMNYGYWINKFITELGVFHYATNPIELYC